MMVIDQAVGGMSIEEIAAKHKSNSNAVKSKIRRLRKKLNILMDHLPAMKMVRFLAHGLSEEESHRAEAHLASWRSGEPFCPVCQRQFHMLEQVSKLYQLGSDADQIAQKMGADLQVVSETIFILQTASLYFKGLDTSEIVKQLYEPRYSVEEAVARLREAQPHPDDEKLKEYRANTLKSDEKTADHEASEALRFLRDALYRHATRDHLLGVFANVLACCADAPGSLLRIHFTGRQHLSSPRCRR